MSVLSRALPALLLVAAALPARAESGYVLVHHGRLFDGSDRPVTARVSATFRIVDRSARELSETELWKGTCQIDVQDGAYAVTLGRGCGEPLTDAIFPKDAPRFFEVTIGGTALQPRLSFGIVPIASRAWNADALAGLGVDAFWKKSEAVDAETLGGRTLADLDSRFARIDGASAGGLTLAGDVATSGAITAAGNVSITGAGHFSGSGRGLTDVPAGALTGTVDAARLPANVARLDAPAPFTADVSVAAGAKFSGDGSGLTNLAVDLANVTGTLPVSRTTGALPTSRLSGTIANDQIAAGITVDKLASGTMTGNFGASGRIAAGSSIRVGDDTAECTASNAGTIRFRGDTFEACNGLAWSRFGDPLGSQTNPGRSCLEILTKAPGSPTGDYYVQPAGVSAPVKVFCDMTTDGGGYTFYPVTGGKQTCRVTDDNTCKALGMDVVMPRTKAHWLAMVAKYGASYFEIVPGIYRATGSGSYTSCVMRNPASYGSGCSDWRVADGGRWWLRDSTYSEPNGDYTANCWLGITDGGYQIDAGTINGGQQFNDLSCGYCATNYLCSTNDKQ